MDTDFSKPISGNISPLQRVNNPNDVYPDAILNISKETASVFQLKRRFEKTPSMLDLTPPFQRELVWSTKQKSELIESIIMGIPIPVFYVKENSDGVYVVVDGKQRLTTLFEYIDNKFALDKLSILKNYKGLKFSELNTLDQNKLEDCTLTLNVIKAPTSDRVTFDLFDRVNRGGTRLNNQEMRNALYQGNSTKLIDKLAKHPNFIQATEGIDPKHMKDRLLVLRFISFYMLQESISRDTEDNSILTYKSNIEDFLGKNMSFLNSLDKSDRLLSHLESMFIDTMAKATEFIIPLGGFRLPASENNQKRPLNMAFFESLSYLIAKHKFASTNEAKIVYYRLLNNPAYLSSITRSVDSSIQIKARYNYIADILDELNC